jgi:hypothetical protein
MNFEDIMKKLNQISEAEGEKCKDCGKMHTGACTEEKMTEAEEKCDKCGEVHTGACEKESMAEAEEKCDDCGKPMSKCKCGTDSMKETFEMLRRLSGQEVVAEAEDLDESDPFIMAAAAAEKAGKTEFEFPKGSGKMHKVTVKKDVADKVTEEATPDEYAEMMKKGGEENKDNNDEDGHLSPFSKVEENELRKLAGLQECGDMPEVEVTPMSPMTMVNQMEPHGQQEPGSYTLSIRRGENNLTMTTDSPEEIMKIMKLAGIMPGAEVTQSPSEVDVKVDEDWANTPVQTREREPKAYGDIRDWAMKGTGKTTPGAGMNKPSGQGDNPMFEEYKLFKNK